MDAPLNNEDKQAWCDYGEQLEKEFVSNFTNQNIRIGPNPDKEADRYTHDFFATFRADLKSIRTPFRTAGRYGIPTEYALTINEKDVNRYKEMYPNIILFFDIDYPNYKGVRMASIG